MLTFLAKVDGQDLPFAHLDESPFCLPPPRMLDFRGVDPCDAYAHISHHDRIAVDDIAPPLQDSMRRTSMDGLDPTEPVGMLFTGAGYLPALVPGTGRGLSDGRAGAATEQCP